MENNRTIRLQTINERYSGLATSGCCLSCGGAVHAVEIRPGEVCVDIGSGRGADTIRMADSAGHEGFAYGVDLSDGMIEKARSTAERIAVANVRFVKSELEHIALEDGIADAVISNCAINHAADKGRVWKEIFRILKPGGRFVVSDIYAAAPVPEEYRTDPAAVAECWAGASTRDEYIEAVAAAGFADFRIIEESEPYRKGMIDVASWTVAARKP